jgi:predicted amidophosphoribosyltransferase
VTHSIAAEQLVQESDALTPALTVPPSDAEDVCSICRSWRARDHEYCWNCSTGAERLSYWCRSVLPISLYRRPSALREWLKFYKPNDDGIQIDEYRRNVALILARYLAEHGELLQSYLGGFDAVSVVPSTDRPGPHALSILYREFASEYGPECIDVLGRGPGPLGFNVCADDSWVVKAKVGGRRLLIVDDVYTTGSRSQSAASALVSAGADVPGILVIARRVNPGWNAGVEDLWNRQRRVAFSFSAPPYWLGG